MFSPRKIVPFFLMITIVCSAGAEEFIGGDALTELYSPIFSGTGGFTTSQGAASASAINPAAGGDAQLITFDAGYNALSGMGDESGLGHAAAVGGLLPTKYAVFGASLRFLHSPFDTFPVGTTFGGNLSAAKELYPGMSVGAGLNFGFGTDWTLSGDLGFRYNMGKLGFTDNFTWAVTMKNLGKSWPMEWLTPAAGVSADLVTIAGKDGKPSPFKLGAAVDVGFPGFTNMNGKAGISATIADLVVISGSLGFNVQEIIDGTNETPIPSVGIRLKFTLDNTGSSEPGKLPSDGEVAVSLSGKPIYNDIWAIGGGVIWTVGVPDKKPPVITLDYPETVWISPNNDGLADALEFPIAITDQRYVMEWIFEIQDESGAAVRTYRNKDRRPETEGVRNVISRLTDVKSGVEIPETLRWDGSLEAGGVAPDGRYFFVISAADDNGNRAVTGRYEVMVDNTPPEVALEEISVSDRIFSPDGDGNKDTLEIVQSGSAEDLWDAGIYDAAGTKVKTFDVAGGAPETIIWDGTDDSGAVVSDGVYSYRISATDRALNSTGAVIENIIVNTIRPAVTLHIGEAFFSPNGDGIKDIMVFTPGVPVTDGVVEWSVEIRDGSGAPRRTISGSGSVRGRIEFNGRDSSGTMLAEGAYQAFLSVYYRNGYVSTAVSPAFTLDITPPSAAIRADYTAFSPNNDGIQDTMIFIQDGSEETSWTGEIRSAGPGNGTVKTFRFSGRPDPRLEWDGRDDTGRLAPDGNYEYHLSATDEAGNSGASNVIAFSLSTADTPVMVSTDLRAFSPNNDRVKDTITILPQIQVREGIASYRIDIRDSRGTAVRTFEGTGSVPASINWNGRDSGGNQVPDGSYTAEITVVYTMGNQPTARSQAFLVDTQAPEAEISVPYTLFSPNGDSRRDTLPITVTAQGSDEWYAAVTDARGTEIQAWSWKGQAPEIRWNGTDRAGNPVADGTYRFELRAEDEAGNSTRKTLDAITVDARVPRAFLTASVNAIAPKEGSANAEVRFAVMLTPRDGVGSWSLELRDETGTLRRRFAGQASAPPEAIIWDGRDEAGTIREGKYTARLTVDYEKGDQVDLTAGPVTVDISGPVLSFTTRPEYFSPDNDGVDDDLFISLKAEDSSPIASWSFEIREPVAPYNLFYSIEGRGTPSDRIVWDGRSNKGELVQAATDYPVRFTAADTLGNTTSIDGMIGVDVLVIRDGDVLRIQVPSIIFRENAADFESLAEDTVANNLRVLRRVAEILNKFKDYRVKVEGHANPVTRTAAEERNELQPLSEARAKAVVDRLVGFGVDRNRLTYVGMGGTRPVVKYEDHDNWWKNRRVEFILIK
ncbi:FlgD immunoglobulin-like domain containing protein [Breznakiella homolactica]|uniref:Gliding motility-associated C-terminal domain-containing protein n=1 Tax=Breznakiella homolactica TaxID=2798577 RepID=A0A7T7XM64_9SPIR|nr:FlgD immunoglobulin-like domain containing protein [Breznakiella homolactica]QQO08926.1 gliding motility-associated C-terminal domain-containing protein [Breznakiella homolactica]